ncbi:MAG: hypothetical protein GEU75_14225 [Dehalococcoidia bacterium]|nr:hypothetical protein [Dehalococcoidia bacterium]
MLRSHEYAARLFLAWLNERFNREFSFEKVEDGILSAVDSDAGRVAIVVAELFEATDAWRQRCSELEKRLDAARPGSYLLWLPPKGELPAEEPDESEWVRRVVLAASRVASGRGAEVRLPVKLALGKVKDEGGYASVTGGLGRHWTDISTQLQGSFYLDSRGLNRFTRNEEERQELYDQIGMLSQGLAAGDVTEFEHEDAWSIQRLPRGAAGEGMTDGWAITGCPPTFEPDDGSSVRRVLRRRLADAAEALSGVKESTRILVLIGAYTYMELENAGPALRGFDPVLAAPFDAIGLVSDAEAKALLVSRTRFEKPT